MKRSKNCMYVEENEKYIEKINVVLSNRFSNAITNNFVPGYLGIMVKMYNFVVFLLP